MRTTKTRKRSKATNKKEGIKAEQQENITMLSAIETILAIAKDSSLSLEIFEHFEEYPKYLADLQGVSIFKAILLSYFVEGSSDGSSVTISDLARFFDCPKVRVMKY